jgi:hypothetical protein
VHVSDAFTDDGERFYEPATIKTSTWQEDDIVAGFADNSATQSHCSRSSSDGEY